MGDPTGRDAWLCRRFVDEPTVGDVSIARGAMPLNLEILFERCSERPEDPLLLNVGNWSSPEDDKPGIGGKC